MRKISLFIILVYSSLCLSKTESEMDLIKSCQNGDDVSCTRLKSRCDKNPKKSALACALYGTYRFLERDDESGYDKYIVKACKNDKRFCGTKDEYLDIKKIDQAKNDCPNSSNYKTCIPLEKACDKKDIVACNSIALHWLNKDENDAGVPYLKKACTFGDEDACERAVTFSKLSDMKKNLDEKQRNLENEYRQREIANEEQRRRTDAVNAFGNAVNNWNRQQNPPQPKQQRCRTVVIPGNGMDGAAAYMNTVCD